VITRPAITIHCQSPIRVHQKGRVSQSPFGVHQQISKIRPFGINDFQSSAIDTVDAKYRIYNPRLFSQAGRRGFDPRLPLHEINQLRRLTSAICSNLLLNVRYPYCLLQSIHRRAAPLER